jgi:hypothetical protein
MRRQYATVSGIGPHPTSHFLGWPPDVGGRDDRELLPIAAVIYMITDIDGVFVLRYTADGSFAGDTWDASEEEALEQIGQEFVLGREAWSPLPDTVTDLSIFTRETLEKPG